MIVLEDFILERSFDGGAMTDHEEVVSVADLRELFKGKVLAPTISIQFAIDCIEYARGEVEASGMKNEEGRSVLLNLHDTHLELLRHALHPTSEDK